MENIISTSQLSTKIAHLPAYSDVAVAIVSIVADEI